MKDEVIVILGFFLIILYDGNCLLMKILFDIVYNYLLDGIFSLFIVWIFFIYFMDFKVFFFLIIIIDWYYFM